MCRLLIVTFAILLFVFGLVGFWMMPNMIQQKIEQRLELKIGTKTFERFTKVPIPLTVKFHLFNVTNSERVLLGLERPQFKEVGPFMYKQWRRREIIDFEDNNRRLRYREIKTFYPMYKHQNFTKNYFNKQKHNTSDNINGSQPIMLDPYNTIVTIINLPLLSVLTKLAQLEEGFFKRDLAAKIATRLIEDGRDQILITKPANQILFDGYKVDFLESARDLFSDTLGFNFESPLPGNNFGFFYNKNGTWSKQEGGELTIFSGRNGSMRDFMIVENWNDQRGLNVWPNNTVAGDSCNQIRGTDGSQFHPGVRRDQLLSIFSPLVCRSLRIKYVEDTKVNEIPLFRFTTPPEVFAAPKKSPKNACYCTIQPPALISQNGNQDTSSTSRRINDSRCYLDGLMDLSLCQRGAPVAASSPHFYNADPMLAMASGLKPQKGLHETYIDIEPMTGSVFRAASRAQLNAFVEQAALEVVDSSIIGNMTPMVAPMLWLEETAEIDDKSSNEFKAKLLNQVQKLKRTCFFATIAGIVLALVVAIQYWYVFCYSIDTGKFKIGDDKPKIARTRPQNDRYRQRRANIRLASERRNPMKERLHEIVMEDEMEDSDGTSFSSSVGFPVIAAAAVLGAASGPSGRRKYPVKDRRRKLRSAQPEDDNNEEEEQILEDSKHSVPSSSANNSEDQEGGNKPKAAE